MTCPLQRRLQMVYTVDLLLFEEMKYYTIVSTLAGSVNITVYATRKDQLRARGLQTKIAQADITPLPQLCGHRNDARTSTPTTV